MISEKYFIENYKFFWDELFPGVQDYIRKLNKIDDTSESKISIINLESKIDNIDSDSSLVGIVNDISFRFFEMNKNKASYNIEKDTEKLFREFKTLKRYQNISENANLINEIETISALTSNLIERFEKFKNINIFPLFYGCGILNEVKGDVIYENTLVEIKARGQKRKRTKKIENQNDLSKSAGFKSEDLFQLFIYASLYYSENSRTKEFRYGEILRFELFNPRLLIYWNESIETVARNISGGSAIDVYDEILRFIGRTNMSL